MRNAAKIVAGLVGIVESNSDLYVEEREVIAEAVALIEQLSTLVDPTPCPDCTGLAAVTEDVKTRTFAVGCRQAFFRRDEADAECKDHPSIVMAGTRDEAVASWNAWAAGRRVFLA